MASNKNLEGNKKLTGEEIRLANLIPAQKGEVRNPNGRPKKENAWADIYNLILDSQKVKMEVLSKSGDVETIELTEKNTIRYGIGIALSREALKGNVNAARELADRTAGKPKQETESKIILEEEEDLSLLSEEELHLLLELKRKAGGTNNNTN